MNYIYTFVIIALSSIFSVLSVKGKDLCTRNVNCTCFVSEIQGEQLLVADCARMNLTRVPVFSNSVQWINLSGNNLTRFAGTLPRHLRGLNMSNNPIHTLSVSSFRGLGHLSDLIMRNTSLDLLKLPSGIFKDLTNLTYLDIKVSKTLNMHVAFPFGEFSTLKDLKSLLMDGYPAMFGYQMTMFTKLRQIDISGITGNCRVTVIDETFFAFVENITYLDLSGCHIRSIRVGTISKFRSLQYLDISLNKEMSFAALENVTREVMHSDIETFRLNEIHCTHGPGTILLESDLKWLQNTSLKSISVDSNRVEFIEVKVLTKLPKSIRYISVRDNKLIAGLYMFWLFELPKLTAIDISYQERTIIPSYKDFFFCQENSDRCRGQSTSLQYENTFTSIEKYSESNLHVTEEGYGDTSNIKIFVPLPESVETISYVDSKLKTEIPWMSFSTNKVKEAFLRDNVLFAWYGPIENVSHVRTLDLSRNFCTHVSTVFFDYFKSLIYLDISENYLGYSFQSDSDGLILKGLGNLQRIQLSSNKISYLPKQVFRHLSNLQTINISHNLMTTLDVDLHHMGNLRLFDLSFNQMPTIAAERREQFTKLGKNLKVNVTGNPLQCNCDDLEFWKWLHQSPFVQYSRNQVCRMGTFKDVINQDTTSLKDSILYMEKSCASYTVLTVGVSCGIAIGIALVISGLVYRYRWKLRYLYYTAKARHYGYAGMRQIEDHKAYMYDCFISYADEDRRFALHEMMNNLETNSDLKLCFHHRDFTPGLDIADNITNAIHGSRKTLCVLSPNFLESYWCLYELNMARMEAIYSRKGENILLLILYKTVHPDKLPLSVLSLIESQSYIEYPAEEQGNVAFWVKLKEALSV